MRLCYDTFGSPTQPPILLIMGLAGQMIAWDEAFCRTLAARGFHVVRFDNRDIGRSSNINVPVKIEFGRLILKRLLSRKIDAPYDLRDMATDAVGLLDHLGIKRAHVVGVSMGGMIGQEMAINFPDRMLTLASVMSSTGNPWLPPPTREASSVLKATPPTTLEAYIENFSRTWRILRAGSYPIDEAADRARAIATYERGLNPAGVARQLLAIFVSGDRRRKLASVRTPTLVIHGDADPLVRLRAGRDTARSIPDAKLIIVPGLGHAVAKKVLAADHRCCCQTR